MQNTDEARGLGDGPVGANLGGAGYEGPQADRVQGGQQDVVRSGWFASSLGVVDQDTSAQSREAVLSTSADAQLDSNGFGQNS